MGIFFLKITFVQSNYITYIHNCIYFIIHLSGFFAATLMYLLIRDKCCLHGNCLQSTVFNFKFFLFSRRGDRSCRLRRCIQLKHPHLPLVNDSPVLINNFFSRCGLGFFVRRDFFCAYQILTFIIVSIGLLFSLQTIL